MTYVNGPFVILASDPFHCPACRWCGTAEGAVCQVDDVVRCPTCGHPLDCGTARGDGADESVTAQKR